MDFIKIETRASGSVGIQGIQDVRKLYGANIVIVEDIVDTGRTMVKVAVSFTIAETCITNDPDAQIITFLSPVIKGAIFLGEIPAKAGFDCLPFAKAKQGAYLSA